MQVGQTSWVHEAPAFSRRLDGAVVSMETAASALEVCVLVVEGDVDGEGGRVVVRPKEGLSFRSVLHHKVHHCISFGVVSREDLQRDWGDELSEEVQPFFFKPDLFHVDIVSGNGLVASRDPLVLMFAPGPRAVVFHLLHQLVTGRVREQREPEHVWTRLLHVVVGEYLGVVLVDVLLLPVHWVFEYLPQVVVIMRNVIIGCGN